MLWDKSFVFLVVVSIYLFFGNKLYIFYVMGHYWRTSIDPSPPASPRFDLIYSPTQSGVSWPKVHPACLGAVRRNVAALVDVPSPGAQRINSSFADDLELEPERHSNLSPASTVSQWVEAWAHISAVLFFFSFFFFINEHVGERFRSSFPICH